MKQAYLEGAFDNPMTAVISFPHVLGHEVRRHRRRGRQGRAPGEERRSRRLLPVDHLRGARPAGVRGRRFALCQNFAGGRFSAGIHHGTCCDLSGGFATHMPAHESACFPIPSDVTFEEAALADPFSVCLHAVHKAPPRRRETVVVVGCS